MSECIYVFVPAGSDRCTFVDDYDYCDEGTSCIIMEPEYDGYMGISAKYCYDGSKSIEVHICSEGDDCKHAHIDVDSKNIDCGKVQITSDNETLIDLLEEINEIEPTTENIESEKMYICFNRIMKLLANISVEMTEIINIRKRINTTNIANNKRAQ